MYAKIEGAATRGAAGAHAGGRHPRPPPDISAESRGILDVEHAMKTRAAFLSLIAELEGDSRELRRVSEMNERAWLRIREGAADPIDWGALGFTLHNLYGILENYFLRISKFFENNLPADRRHKGLVDSMRLEIAGVRPSLFPDDAGYRQALTLMRFRHRFRNLYGEDLDPEKTSEVQATAASFMQSFPAMHRLFIDKIRAISGGLE